MKLEGCCRNYGAIDLGELAMRKPRKTKFTVLDEKKRFLKLLSFGALLIFVFISSPLWSAESKIEDYKIRIEKERLQQLQDQIWRLEKRLKKSPDDLRVKETLTRLMAEARKLKKSIRAVERQANLSNLEGYKIGVYVHKHDKDMIEHWAISFLVVSISRSSTL